MMVEGDCVYYTGAHRNKCKAGVVYLELVDRRTEGMILRLPCLVRRRDGGDGIETVSCEKYRGTTKEEVERDRQPWDCHVTKGT